MNKGKIVESGKISKFNKSCSCKQNTKKHIKKSKKLFVKSFLPQTVYLDEKSNGCILRSII
jgi:hypothetical protein